MVVSADCFRLTEAAKQAVTQTAVSSTVNRKQSADGTDKQHTATQTHKTSDSILVANRSDVWAERYVSHRLVGHCTYKRKQGGARVLRVQRTRVLSEKRRRSSTQHIAAARRQPLGEFASSNLLNSHRKPVANDVVAQAERKLHTCLLCDTTFKAGKTREIQARIPVLL